MQKPLLVILFSLIAASSVAAQRIDLVSVPAWETYTSGKSSRDTWYGVDIGGDFGLLMQPASVKVIGVIRDYWVKLVDMSDGEVLELRNEKVNCADSTFATVYIKAFFDYEESDSEILAREKLDTPMEFDYGEDLKWKRNLPDTVGKSVELAACSIK